MVQEPLATKLRPITLDEISGQDHILGKNMMLRRMIEADMLSSIILYGPPGTGKTSIASVIAHVTDCNFKAINATTAGKSDMKKVTDEAEGLIKKSDKRTILFIDEIHRFNKAQQDYLLPFVEKEIIILIGATTENPYFEINGALLSRSLIFEVKPLDEKALHDIIARAIKIINKESKNSVIIEQEAERFLINIADGDARVILNAIDLAIRTTSPVNNQITINLDTASQCVQKKIKQYDKNGDNHYDSISAFIESMKHSEVDAAIHYLARMIDRGEDPKYIARRLIVCASRDIGVACPEALHIAIDAFTTVEKVGLPECVPALVMSTIYNSMAPKSNTGETAYQKALKDIQDIENIQIPDTLKDESYKSAWKLGHGGVSDVFASPFNYDGFECMPDKLKGKEYYQPGNTGYEITIKRYKEWCRSIKMQMTDQQS